MLKQGNTVGRVKVAAGNLRSLHLFGQKTLGETERGELEASETTVITPGKVVPYKIKFPTRILV